MSAIDKTTILELDQFEENSIKLCIVFLYGNRDLTARKHIAMHLAEHMYAEGMIKDGELSSLLNLNKYKSDILVITLLMVFKQKVSEMLNKLLLKKIHYDLSKL